MASSELANMHDQYRLYVKTVQGSAIRTLFETLKEIVIDTSLTFDSTGVRLSTMDSARCALIHLRLDADKFDIFHCPEPVQCGLNILHIFQLLRSVGTHDCVAFHQNRTDSDILGITITNSEKHTVTNFRLKLLDVDSEIIKIRDEDFQSIITMPSAFFQRLCRDMANIGPVLKIRSDREALTLSVDGDFATQETRICHSETSVVRSDRDPEGSFAEEEVIESNYSLKYISLFCKASGLCANVELFLKKAFPLILRFSIASLGEIRFVLAPQLE